MQVSSGACEVISSSNHAYVEGVPSETGFDALALLISRELIVLQNSQLLLKALTKMNISSHCTHRVFFQLIIICLPNYVYLPVFLPSPDFGFDEVVYLTSEGLT